jgi:transposase InsO family protein
VVGQPRQTQRYEKTIRDDEQSLICDILSLVRQFPRYGYRLIWSKLKQLGWQNLNVKRVYRIWRQEGLKVPKKKHKKRRLGDSSNSIQRRKAEGINDVWSWDFIFDRTTVGRPLKWLGIIDEFTRENLCLEVEHNMTSEDIINLLAELFKTRGVPNHIRSDNGPEFIANALKGWLGKLGIETLYIEPGSPWENGFSESFNSRFRDEFLALEEFENLAVAKALTSIHRTNYNEERPHSSLDYMTPTDFARQFSASSACAPEA